MSTARVSAADLKRLTGGSYAAHQTLQEACHALCELYGVPCWDIHTGPRVAPRPGGGFDLRSNKKQRGVGDSLAALPPIGQLLALEFKTGAARPSEEQQEFRKKVTRAGAVYLVVRDVEELDDFLSKRVIAPARATRGRTL